MRMEAYVEVEGKEFPEVPVRFLLLMLTPQEASTLSGTLDSMLDAIKEDPELVDEGEIEDPALDGWVLRVAIYTPENVPQMDPTIWKLIKDGGTSA